MPIFPKNVVDILWRYSASDPYLVESDEWKQLSENGLIYPVEEMSHEEACEWILTERKNAPRNLWLTLFSMGFPMINLKCVADLRRMPFHTILKSMFLRNITMIR